jgi:hypothetical protein
VGEASTTQQIIEHKSPPHPSPSCAEETGKVASREGTRGSLGCSQEKHVTAVTLLRIQFYSPHRSFRNVGKGFLKTKETLWATS